MHKDSRAVRVSVAAASAGAGILLRAAADSLLAPAGWYLAFTPLVAFSAWYGGLKPGLIATAMLAAANRWLSPGQDFDDALLFVFAGSVISWALQSVRVERQRSQNIEQSLRGVLGSTRDAVISIDQEFRILFANAAAGELAGRPAGELTGRSLRTIFPESPRVVLYRELSHALREKVEMRIEDGLESAQRWFAFSISPVPAGLNLFITDITAAKREQIERTRVNPPAAQGGTGVEALLRQLPVGVAILDSELRVQMANPAVSELFGTPLRRGDSMTDLATQVVRRADGRRIAKEDLPISIAQRTGIPVSNFEGLFCTEGAEVRNVVVNCLPVAGKQGGVSGVIATYSDITSLRKMERRLSLSEAKLRRLLETPFISVFAGAGERITEANDAFLRMVGYSREELEAGLSWAAMTPPGFEEIDGRALRQLAEQGFSEPFEKEYIRKDGEHVSILATVASYAGDEPNSWIAWVLDLSEKKRLEGRLRDAARLESVGLLAGGIAHDFNNILTGVLGNASLALESLSDHDAARQWLTCAIESAERAATLTRQLLAYSGQGRFVVEPVHVDRLIEETSRLIQSSIPRSIGVELTLAPDLPPVEADAVQLRQLLMNLTINGAEAIGDKEGFVRISATCLDADAAWMRAAALDLPAGRYVSIEVRDTGCGMDDNTLRHIFDPFFTTKFTGRGLGLAAALGIAHGHKGAIRVYSAPGVGSTFRVLLPACAAAQPAPRESVDGAAGPGGGDTILVVDDEETVRAVARASLERYGYRVLVAQDGREALSIYQRRRAEIDLVLLDLTMPIMGGQEAFRALREVDSNVKVLLTSGFGEPDLPARTAFLQKPYSAEVLVRRVYRALHSSEVAS